MIGCLVQPTPAIYPTPRRLPHTAPASSAEGASTVRMRGEVRRAGSGAGLRPSRHRGVSQPRRERRPLSWRREELKPENAECAGRRRCPSKIKEFGTSRFPAPLLCPTSARRRRGGASSRVGQAAFFSGPLISISAICTVLSAAPLRRLSETTHRLRPFSMVGSTRMRLTKVAKSPTHSTGVT